MRSMVSGAMRFAHRRIELIEIGRACRPARRCRMQHGLEAGQRRFGDRRHVREDRGAFAPVTASARTLPSLTMTDRGRQRRQVDRHVAANQIGQRGRRCPIGHWVSLMSAMLFEQHVPRWMPLPTPADA